MGPFVLAETHFPSFSASASFLSHSSNKASGSSEKRSVSTPTSTTTAASTSTSTLSVERFGDPEEHYVEVVHSSPGRRPYHHKPQNDSRTTTITTTRNRNGNIVNSLSNYRDTNKINFIKRNAG